MVRINTSHPNLSIFIYIFFYFFGTSYYMFPKIYLFSKISLFFPPKTNSSSFCNLRIRDTWMHGFFIFWKRCYKFYGYKFETCSTLQPINKKKSFHLMLWLYFYDTPLYIKAYKSDIYYLIYLKLIDLYTFYVT